MRKTKTALASVAALFLVTGTANAEVCPDTLKLGWDVWPPYWTKTDDEIGGLDSELVPAVLDEMGCDYKLVQQPFKRLLSSVETGKIDVLPNVWKTEERQKYGYYSDTYLTSNTKLIVKKGHDGSYDGLKDFLEQGNEMATQIGYDYSEDITKIIESPKYKDQIRGVRKMSLAFKMIDRGRIDGTIENEFVASATLRKAGLSDKVTVTDTVIKQVNSYVIFSKKSVSKDTVKAFNKAMAKLKDEGEWSKLRDKYLN